MILERWKNVNTYVIGKLHITNQLPCQDRTFYYEANGVKVLSLADGAGSKKLSQIGADIVCKEICTLLANNFVEYLLKFEFQNTDKNKHEKNMASLSKVIINHLVNALKKQAIELNVGVEELSSTLLFVAVKDNHYIMGHLGDGVIAGLYSENNTTRVRVLSDPENGEKKNVTYFVPDSDADQHLRLEVGRMNNLKGILLTSDGAGTVLFNNQTIDGNVIKIFNNFIGKTSDEYEKILRNFLENMISNYSSDDLSFNVLLLENADTETISKEYGYYLLSNIRSKSQITKRSSYCYNLDSSKPGKKDLPNNETVKEYILWK